MYVNPVLDDFIQTQIIPTAMFPPNTATMLAAHIILGIYTGVMLLQALRDADVI